MRGCKCPICQMEQELALGLKSQLSIKSFQTLTDSFPPLAGFASPRDLIEHLHRQDNTPAELRLLDGIFAFLIQLSAAGSIGDTLSLLLALAFIPTLHKTYREVCLGFPTLSADDVGQQLLTALFLVLRSRRIQSRSSHIAVAVSALVRTNVLRWATQQARGLSEFEPLDSLDENAPELVADGNFEKTIMLQDLLDQCSADGDLSKEDYELLLKVKVEGFEAKELAGLDGGPSAMAIHQRIHRIMDRLRRRASR